MKIAIIPARGGSKRIPRKNIRQFLGKPMLAWSIAAARHSGCFDRIIVSTDDNEVAETALAYNAEIPFIRPKHLSDDYTGTIPVIAHAIRWLEDHGETVTEACCIYATAPFIQSDDLQLGLETLRKTNSEFTFSATSYAFPIQRAFRITNEQRIEMFEPQNFSTRSQDLAEAWHDAGQFYWGTKQAWLDNKIIFGSNSSIIKIPRYRAQDIDTIEDWEHAELMFRALWGITNK